MGHDVDRPRAPSHRHRHNNGGWRVIGGWHSGCAGPVRASTKQHEGPRGVCTRMLSLPPPRRRPAHARLHAPCSEWQSAITRDDAPRRSTLKRSGHTRDRLSCVHATHKIGTRTHQHCAGTRMARTHTPQRVRTTSRGKRRDSVIDFRSSDAPARPQQQRPHVSRASPAGTQRRRMRTVSHCSRHVLQRGLQDTTSVLRPSMQSARARPLARSRHTHLL